MNTNCFWIIERIPNAFNKFLVVDFVKNSIRGNSNEVMIFCDFKAFDFWNCNDYIRIATKLFDFCFYVAKSSWDTKSTWHHSMRANYILLFLIRRSIYQTWYICLCLINLASSIKNTLLFCFFCWFMIYWHRNCSISSFKRKYSTRISNIRYITHFTNDKNHNRTWTRSIYDTRISKIDWSKFFFSFSESILNG